ncbi:hypothetical protein, partial [Nonomuraea sp. NPDC005501]|uniref:hypothetical protein n=1 Tax=Nonomuraea sp. NPDC005501 TaxID=3156884 RepID=UPI0033B58D94
ALDKYQDHILDQTLIRLDRAQCAAGGRRQRDAARRARETASGQGLDGSARGRRPGLPGRRHGVPRPLGPPGPGAEW